MSQTWLCLDTEHQPGSVYVADDEARILLALPKLAPGVMFPTARDFVRAERLGAEVGYEVAGSWEALSDGYAILVS